MVDARTKNLAKSTGGISLRHPLEAGSQTTETRTQLASSKSRLSVISN